MFYLSGKEQAFEKLGIQVIPQTMELQVGHSVNVSVRGDVDVLFDSYQF